MENKKITIIGCGNLGKSILEGLLENHKPHLVTVTKRNIEELQVYKNKGVNITNNNKESVKDSDIIILAVKPYNVLNIIDEIKSEIDPKKHILVSVATGITLQEMQNQLGTVMPIFRAMPNIAASVVTSITCICSIHSNEEQNKNIHQLFECIGTTIDIKEDLMEAATVLGACGIAYVLRFIRAMVQGGIQIGFDSKTASQVVNQTVFGASKILLQNNNHPEYEIDKVTTPKGCTIVGLNEMEHNGFSSALIKGIVASFQKIEKK